MGKSSKKKFFGKWSEKKNLIFLTIDQKKEIYNLYWSKNIKNKRNFIGKKYNVSQRTIRRLFNWFNKKKDSSIYLLENQGDRSYFHHTEDILYEYFANARRKKVKINITRIRFMAQKVCRYRK